MSSLEPSLLDRFPPICGKDYALDTFLSAVKAKACCFQTQTTYDGLS
ncbi:hypothetical protein ISN44_As01g034370 [Arabidopsis suecica]|uniref:Uncharacterized protein n=1 Tax=Arabidopsis suecica TaxID=45249 RepID=A0A8T2HBT5_ARASU|nr:hypothetical protein ISN44_As01g034370 [Arabidopsis suecica]